MQRKPVVKAEDSSNIKTDTYTLKAADPFFDCDDGGIKINHILKFHPSDKDVLEQYGHEWILRREVPPKQEESEKQPRRKSKFAETATGVEPDQVCRSLVQIECTAMRLILGLQNWKLPLLLTGPEDPEFLRAFTARREKNEVSCGPFLAQHFGVM